MSEMRISPTDIEDWLRRSLQIRSEIRGLEAKRAERRKSFPVKRPESPADIDDFLIGKIRELRAELKDIQTRLLMATYDDPS